MTKTVRIENADTSAHKIVVYIEYFNKENNEWIRLDEPAANLEYPTSMYSGSIWDTRRLVIEEYT